MKMYRFAVASCLLSVGAVSHSFAQDNEATIFNYTHEGKVYPPVFFVTNVEDKSIKEKLEEYKAFTALDDKAVGLPIGVRVLKGHRTKQDGTQFSSLMLSASTLGIIPVVSNKEFKVQIGRAHV